MRAKRYREDGNIFNLPRNLQVYRNGAEDAKGRKGKWVADENLLFSAFLCVLCGFAVHFSV